MQGTVGRDRHRKVSDGCHEADRGESGEQRVAKRNRNGFREK